MVKRKRVEIKGDINLLSPLEEKIMEFLWKNSSSTVAEISQSVEASLSSVAATIDRLIQHGYVIRKKKKVDGRMKYVYSPALMREEANRKMVEDILDALVEKFGDVVVNYFQQRGRRNGER
jgi:predicted transcriptional regulator